MNSNARLAAKILTYTLAGFLIIVGLDKALSLEKITDWTLYLGPVSTTVFPFAAETVVRIQGCIEVLIGALILYAPWRRIALWLFIASTFCVIIDLASHRYYVLIMRDLVMVGATAALLLLLAGEKKGA